MKADKKVMIVDSAKELFQHYGIRKTTVEDIAKKAKIGKGTIYSYYNSKEEIFEAVIDKEVAAFEDIIAGRIKDVKNCEEKLKTFVAFHMEVIQRFSDFFTTFSHEYYEYFGEIEKIRKKYDENEREHLRQILAEGVNEGYFEIQDIGLTVFTMQVAMKGMEIHWGSMKQSENVSKQIEIMMDVFFNGIRKKR